MKTSIPWRALQTRASLAASLCAISAAFGLGGLSQNVFAEQRIPDASRMVPAASGSVPAPVVRLTREGLERDYKSIGLLIDASTASRQIDSSGVAGAQQFKQQAREAQAMAADALRSGDLAEADALLKAAAQSMMEGVRMARPEEVWDHKNQFDFSRRLDSAKALLAAGKRVALEKGRSIQDLAAAKALLDNASISAAGGKVDEGRAMLDQAYELIKSAVHRMRNGDELIASKRFATKHDEYRYEQERNAQYQQLIGELIRNRTEDPSWADAARKGRLLREEAESTARSLNYDGALTKIDASTKQLKGVLRRAGFPIV